MIPVATPAEMAEIDRSAPEPLEVLVGRASAAVARDAVRLLGGTYGRRVVVLAGKGHNGDDGRGAAGLLRRRGVRVQVVDAADATSRLPTCDLVIDAAYGTGFRGVWDAPEVAPGTAVLAVDIPSGVNGLTGEASGRVLDAVATTTFAALKPGLLFGAGSGSAGSVRVADIGLDASRTHTGLVTDEDVQGWLPSRRPDAHKWRAAVWIVAGSPGMTGAATLACAGAQRSGAGYVRLGSPGGTAAGSVPVEVVEMPLPHVGWSPFVLDGLDRFAALVVGNGLGTGDLTAAEIRSVVSGAKVPTVVDADGLTALGREAASVVGPSVILTPHDGEFARLSGAAPGPDRIGAARTLATTLGCVVLLKGGPTVVAGPDGRVAVVATGDARLATAGTGDVLAGVIGGLLASGLDPFEAAASGAFIHGRAGDLGWMDGLVAGDLPALVPVVLDRLRQPDG